MGRRATNKRILSVRLSANAYAAWEQAAERAGSRLSTHVARKLEEAVAPAQPKDPPS